MTSNPTIALGEARVGFRGRIQQLSVNGAGVGTGLAGPELERRLIELGFVEGWGLERGLRARPEHRWIRRDRLGRLYR